MSDVEREGREADVAALAARLGVDVADVDLALECAVLIDGTYCPRPIPWSEQLAAAEDALRGETP